MSFPLSIFPNDDHYLAITWVVTVALQLTCFAVAWVLQVDKLTDFAGSANFILVALLSYCAGESYSRGTPALIRPAIATALLCAARLELAAFLLYRVLRRGKDDRFDSIRTNFVSFLAFWVFQMVWAWGVSLPVIFVNADTAASPFGVRDGVGIALWAIGFLMQVFADLQKDRFRSDPLNAGRWCDAGLWSWSRHPNFCGEILLWWGIFCLCAPQFEASRDASGAGVPGTATWGYATIVSPILTMLLLLFASGMPTAEGVNQRRFLRTPAQKAAFLEYRGRTSPLIPLPPSLYAALPITVKRWLLFELSMYETDWTWEPSSGSDGDNQQQKERESTRTASLGLQQHASDASGEVVTSWGAGKAPSGRVSDAASATTPLSRSSSNSRSYT